MEIIILYSENNKKAINSAGKVQIFLKLKHLVTRIETETAVMAQKEVKMWNVFSLAGRAYIQ